LISSGRTRKKEKKKEKEKKKKKKKEKKEIRYRAQKLSRHFEWSLQKVQKASSFTSKEIILF